MGMKIHISTFRGASTELFYRNLHAEAPKTELIFLSLQGSCQHIRNEYDVINHWHHDAELSFSFLHFMNAIPCKFWNSVITTLSIIEIMPEKLMFMFQEVRSPKAS